MNWLKAEKWRKLNAVYDVNQLKYQFFFLHSALEKTFLQHNEFTEAEKSI
jgi:hypothetical protein